MPCTVQEPAMRGAFDTSAWALAIVVSMLKVEH